MDCDWIFFDCFNTLIDDFDQTGDESGLSSLPTLAVELGLVRAREDFFPLTTRGYWSKPDGMRETTLDERLTWMLNVSTGLPDERVGPAVTALLGRWEKEFPTTLRLTPEVREMLERFCKRKRLGVVSNFFIPFLPAQYLESFRLAHRRDLRHFLAPRLPVQPAHHRHRRRHAIFARIWINDAPA